MIESPAIHGPKYGLDVYYTAENDLENDGVVRDETTNNNHGGVAGYVTSVSGYDGNAMRFISAVGGYISVPTLGYSGNASLTVSAWIRPTSGGRTCIFGFGTAGSPNNFIFFTNSDGELQLNSDGNSMYAPVDNYYDTWSHVVALHDGTTGRRAIYHNGTLAAEGTRLSSINNTTYRIGRWNGSHQFNGKIDSLRVYRRVLSDTEITALSNSV